tara:strand:- start:81 stop:296 length:216 start_codon:yes stop_codon:yes gene_type:complete
MNLKDFINDLNDKQKIFVLVGVGSSVLLFLSFLDEINLFQLVPYSIERWLPIISIFNIAISITGFYLFKDK